MIFVRGENYSASYTKFFPFIIFPKGKIARKNINQLYFVSYSTFSVKDTFFKSLKSNIRTGETGIAK